MALLVAIAVLCAWAIWQPLRSANADSAAIAAVSRGDTRSALADARTAAARDPVSVEPLWERSAILSAIGDQTDAHSELVKAITVQPENPATWLQLGLYDLQQHQPQHAIGVLNRAHALDLSSTQISLAIDQARAELLANRAISTRGRRR